MFVADPILPPVCLPIPFFYRHEIFHVDVEVHFDVHADSPIEERSWAVDVDVRDASFYDLGELFAGLLIGRDADFGFVTSIRVELETRCDRAGEL